MQPALCCWKKLRRVQTEWSVAGRRPGYDDARAVKNRCDPDAVLTAVAALNT